MAKPKPPLAVLKAGILSEDWAAVRAAYSALTGDALESGAKLRPAGKGSKAKPPKAAKKPKLSAPAELPDAEDAAAEAEGAGGVVLLKVPPPAKSAKPDEFKREARPADGPPRFVNRFVPPPPTKRELDIDRKMLKGRQVVERERPASNDEMVEAVCDFCRRTYRAHAWEVDRVIAGDGETDRMQNRCPKC